MLAHFPAEIINRYPVKVFHVKFITYKSMKKTLKYFFNALRRHRQFFMVMRNSIAFILLFALQAHSSIFSQSKISIDLKDSRIEELFKVIESKTQLGFLYDESLLENAGIISVKAENASIETVLAQALQNTGLGFEIDHNTILIKPSPVVVAQQQPQGNKRVVKGKIVDNDNNPLPSATVRVAGTTVGTVTNLDGFYEISIPDGNSVLEFSYVGFVTKKVTVGKQTTINVALESDVINLKEMVVVGYSSQKRSLLTGSVGVVKNDNLKDTPLSSIDGVLQGQVSGVQVMQNSGTPGGEMSVRIRGVSSISGSSQPLYVVDGIPITTGDYAQVGYEGQGTNALSDINPNDIESMSVLKDAAAAAIYGARASNGVILITTKRGSNQKTQFNFNAYYGSQDIWRRLDLLNAKEWKEYRNDLYGKKIFSDQDIANNTIDTDWQSMIFRNAPMQNYELSANGGNNKTRFMISSDYFNQTGVLLGTDYKRMNGRINVDHNASDKLTLGASIGLTYSKTDRVEGDQSLHGVLPNGISTPAIFPVYNTDGSYNQDGPYSNAVSIANGATNENYTYRAIGNGYINYQILKSLSFSTKWGVDFMNMREHTFEFNTIQGQKYNGLGFEAYTNVLNTVSNNFLKYNKTIGNHEFEVMAGYSFEKYEHRSSYIRGQDYASENLEYINSASTIAEANSSGVDNGLESFIGRINYNYADKYLIALSCRSDASSKFGENNRTGYFPAASLAWRLNKESIFHLPKTISELKIRTSYGVTGNDDITPFLYSELYGVSKYNGSSAIYPSNIPNPNLKWETTNQFNLGVDISLFDNRINLSADYYNKQTKDLLLDRPLPGSSGHTSITENIGRLENKGFEVGLTTNNLVGTVKWTTQINLSANRNKVLELYNGEPIDNIGRGGNRVMEGQPISVFYSYQWLGIDPSTGDCVYTDLNKDGKITTDDRMVVGNPHPDFIGGVTNTFSYKGFDLSVFMQFSYGNDVFNGSRLYLESLQGGDNQLASVTRRWKKPGDITDIPRATTDAAAAANNKLVSSRFIEDGSYLRLKNITLGYTFSKTWMQKMQVQSLRVYATAQNLYTWTNYSGFDPEVNYVGNDNTVMGTDFFTYPQSRSYCVGINLKF
jgi:TonB-linked SusC/RagA family outer membrane protein